MIKHILAAVAAWASMTAHAQVVDYRVIANCREPDGVAFMLDSMAVQGDNVGWTEDGMDGGWAMLAQSNDGTYTVVVKGADGKLYTPAKDDGKVFTLLDLRDSVVLLVVYSGGTYELFHFSLGRQPVLTWTILRVDPQAPVRSHKLLVAPCVPIPMDSK